MLDGGGEVNVRMWDKGKHPEWINTPKDKSYLHKYIGKTIAITGQNKIP